MKSYTVWRKGYGPAVGLHQHHVECEQVSIGRNGVLQFWDIHGDIVIAFGRGEWVYFSKE